MEEGYDVAQICMSGHVVTDTALSSPEFRKKFCRRCGAATTMTCLSCETPIQGHYHAGVAIFGGSRVKAPGFCHECGKAYPWTEGKLAAAKEMALEFEGLNDEDRKLLAGSLEDIVREGPRTELATGRFTRLLKKAGQGTGNVLYRVMVDIASEAAKKSLGL